MRESDKSIVKALVAIAWADAPVAAEERAILEAALAAFDASDADVDELEQYAATPRRLDDEAIAGLSVEDRRKLLDCAVVLILVDGEQVEHERQVLKELTQRLALDGRDAQRTLDAARERARRLLELL